MQTIDSLKNMNINPLIKELKPNSLYMAFTYGNSGNIKYSKVWIIHTFIDRCYIQYIAEPTTDDTTSITADGLTVTISSSTTLIMGIYKIS